MNHTIKRAEWKDLVRSSYKGFITISYDELVEKFGEPKLGSGDDKVHASWHAKIDGVPVSIYDWKETLDPRDITQWHIGGFSSEAVNKVHEVIYG